MEIQEYLDTRLFDQINYYSKKSRLNRKYFHWFKTIEISISVVIPFLTGYIKENDFVKYSIGALGIVLAVLTGLEVLFKFHDKWINYRSTLETLKQEKYMFLSQAGPYKNDQSLSTLAERIETILAKENSTWNQLMNQKDEKK
jgi:Protein of unknown function (DUF4231)